MFMVLECLRRTDPISDERPKSCNKCGMEPPSFKIATSTSHSVLRSILDSACQVQQLTEFYLRTMIDRCMVLEPSHLLDPDFGYVYRPHWKTCPQKIPLGVPYRPQISRSPSWVEQERTSRVLCRMQLFFDLRTAVASSKLKWLHADTTRLQSSSVEFFWEGRTFGSCQHSSRTLPRFRNALKCFFDP
jgi:hypothetical protein